MFFKIDLDWLMDLDLLEVILYGIIKTSNTKFCRVDSNGVIYKRISNKFIEYWLPLSKFKIKQLIDNLIEANYLDVLLVKKPSTTNRFLSTKIYQLADVIYIFKDWLGNYDIDVCIALGYIFREYKQSGLDTEIDLDELIDYLPSIYSKLKSLYLLNEDCEPTDDLYELMEITNKSFQKNS